MRQWWRERIGAGEAPVFGNGSGLSREERITRAAAGADAAGGLGARRLMPELVSSLPVTGVDGTLRRSARQGAWAWPT